MSLSFSFSQRLNQLATAACVAVLTAATPCRAGSMEEGIQLYNQKQLEPALSSFAKAVQQNPRDVTSCYYMANCCYGLRRADDAVKLYWYVARNFPSAKESYSARAFLKQIDRDYAAHVNDPSFLTMPQIKTDASEAGATKTASATTTGKAVSSSASSVTASPKFDAASKTELINNMVVVVRAQASRPEVTSGMIASIKKALQAYPNNLLLFAAAKGCKIFLTPTMIDKEPGLQNTQPSGYEEGQTYKNCPGMFERDGIVLTELALSARDDSEWTNSPDPVGTLRHEMGHAIDHYLGRISSTEEFKHIYLLEMAKIDESDRPAIAYFLQKDYRGPSETFAELFCSEYGGRKDDRRTEKLAQHFPELDKYIKRKVAEYTSP